MSRLQRCRDLAGLRRVCQRFSSGHLPFSQAATADVAIKRTISIVPGEDNEIFLHRGNSQMRPEDTLKHYESKINMHSFGELVPLISPDAVFWFNDGSFRGLDEIRSAFEQTWRKFPLENYWLEDVNWLSSSTASACCIYHFRWRASVNGKALSGGGRGTTILRKENNAWKIVHEHLSQFPQSRDITA